MRSELADYSPVSGCLVYRQLGYGIWEKVQRLTDAEFKKIGIENVYFPIFIPERLLRKEQSHVQGFSPEVAWVTHAGDSELDERLAVRPTSETIMYEVISKWIRSWRDLPLRLNQWNNVVRWEFKHPTPLLRTREFLWNEGHTAFASESEARAEREEILAIYAKVTRDYLALPGLVGKKSDKEKFAGALESYSIEHLLPDGKAIQGPDFHFDGQNFAKAFEITFIDQRGERQYAWQNTWAITTREIGVMVAVHSDDRGLVIPPKVAPLQVVIVPIIEDETKEVVLFTAKALLGKLGGQFSAKLDDRDYLTAGKKYNEWEMRGVPLRVEVGPRDIKEGKVVLARRDTLQKRSVPMASVTAEVSRELEEIQRNLFERARAFLEENTHSTASYEQFRKYLAESGGIIRAPWCTSTECEEKIKEETGAKVINIPLGEDRPSGSCIYCGRPAKVTANFARSY